MNKKSAGRVVVVGAGVGGMAAAARLAKDGFSVTVIERNDQVGGRARIWQKNGTIQSQPNGPYISLADRLAAGKITVDADLNVADAAAPAAPADAAPTAPTATTAAEFAFTAEIFGSPYRLAGPTKEDALHALFTKLQELNFSKVAITDRRTGSTVGINDIRNGGEYKLAKQLTAA